MKGVQLLDPSFKDSLCAAAYNVVRGLQNFTTQDIPQCFVLQFQWTRQIRDHRCMTRRSTSNRRGNSRVGIQILEHYTLDAAEVNTLTIIKLVYNPLEKYCTYNWASGCTWKQHRPVHHGSVITRPRENRHHVLALQAIQVATTHLFTWLMENNKAQRARLLMIYLQTYSRHGTSGEHIG